MRIRRSPTWAGSYGFSHLSDVIASVKNDIGAACLFGEYENNNYRLLMLDGWNYLAVPLPSCRG